MTGVPPLPVHGDAPRPSVRARASAALLAIVALGLGLRVFDIARESLWGDEIFSIGVARGASVADVVGAVRLDTHPPLYFLLLHAWIGFFGTSDVAVRSLSALFGVLALPAVYAVGVRLGGRRVGLWAALFAALSPWQIRYAQDARPYELVLLLSALSMHSFLGILRESRARHWALWLAFTSLLLYSHAYGIWVPVAQNLFVAVRTLARRPAPALRPWLLAQAGLAALYAPWVPTILEQASRARRIFSTHETPSPWKAVDTLSHFAGSDVTLAVLGLAVALGVGLSLRRRRSRGGALLLALWLATPILAPLVVSWVSTPVYVSRATMPAAAAFVLLAGLAIAATRRRRALHVVVVAATVLASCVEVGRNHAAVKNEQWREAAASVEASAAAGDALWAVSSVDRDAVEHYRTRSDLALDLRDEAGSRRPDGGAGRPGAVWLFLHDFDGPEAVAAARRLLEAGGLRRAETRRFFKITVERYAR